MLNILYVQPLKIIYHETDSSVQFPTPTYPIVKKVLNYFLAQLLQLLIQVKNIKILFCF